MANHAKVITDKIINPEEVTKFVKDINNKVFFGLFQIQYDNDEKSWIVQYDYDIAMTFWISDNLDEEGNIISKDTCLEFRHGHYFHFMWWVEGVFRENLGKHYNAKMFDEGVGDCGEPEPERFSSFREYVVGDETDKDIIERIKYINFAIQKDEVPADLVMKLDLDFNV